MLKHSLGNDDKENSRSKNAENELQTSLESRALEHIQNNLIIIVNISDLHNYYQWISMYPNLEKLCSVRFINETTKPKEILCKPMFDATLVDEQKVIDSCNFVENFIKDYINENLAPALEDEEHHAEVLENSTEKVAFTINSQEEPDAHSTIKSGTRRSKSLTSKSHTERAQVFKDLCNLNTYPQLMVATPEYFSENRFKSFIETFKQMYTKMKASLLKNKNFNYKYKERCQMIIDIYQQKGLVKESYNCSSNIRQQLANVASLNERIEELHAKIKEKEALIKLKEKIAKDSSDKKAMLKNEIQMSIDERMEKLNQILLALDSCSKRDLGSIPTSYDRLGEHERQLLEILLHIIFLKDVPDQKFSSFVTKTLNMILDKEQLISILRARRDTNFNDNTVRKIKNFTQKWSEDKFDKTVFRYIVKFLQCLVKKFNLKVMLESRYEKLEEVNQILVQAELHMANFKTTIEELKEELEDLLIKQRNSNEDLKRKSKSISEDEARNEQVYKDVLKNLKKAEGKLFKSKVRMKNLFGDCLMLAASISYLGVINQDDRTVLRKTMAATLSNEKSIEVSEYWHSDNDNDNSKIFKKLLCDFGYSEIYHSLSHLFNDCVFSEFFFTLVHSPTTPIIFDSVGY